MRRWIVLLLVAALVVGCRGGRDAVGPGKALPQGNGQGNGDVWLSVAVTNDIHGYLLPRALSLPAAGGGFGRLPYGGIEWLAGYLDLLAARDPVLLLDAGDMFHGTLLSNEVKGASVVAAMNHLGYRAAALGNHEFDFGAEPDGDPDPFSALKARAAEAEFPFLAANVIDRGTGQPVAWPGFASHVIVGVGGLRVAVIGGTTVETPRISGDAVAAALDFRPLEDVLPPLAKRLRAEGADVVVALVHAGGACEVATPPEDLSTCQPDAELFRLARALDPRYVDLVAGGHSHRVIAKRVNGIPVVEGGSSLRAFSLVRLRWSPAERRVMDAVFEGPVPLCHEVPEGWASCLSMDPEVEPPALPAARRPATFLGGEVRPRQFLDGVLTPAMKAGMARAGEVLGPVAVRPLYKTGPGDHPIGLLEADVLLATYPEASVAIVNESGIRAGLPEGPVIYGDLFEVFPFDSHPALLRLTGQELLDLLRVASSGAHGLPVVGGLRLRIDRAADDCIREDWNEDGRREPWERRLLVEAVFADGSAIDPAAEVVVVSNTYLAGGGSDFARVLDRVPEGRRWSPPDPPVLRDIVASWMRGNPVRLGEGDLPLDRALPPRVEVLHPDHVLGSSCAAAAQETP